MNATGPNFISHVYEDKVFFLLGNPKYIYIYILEEREREKWSFFLAAGDFEPNRSLFEPPMRTMHLTNLVLSTKPRPSVAIGLAPTPKKTRKFQNLTPFVLFFFLPILQNLTP